MYTERLPFKPDVKTRVESEIDAVRARPGPRKLLGYVDPVVARKRTEIFSRACAAASEAPCIRARKGKNAAAEAQNDLILIYVSRRGAARP